MCRLHVGKDHALDLVQGILSRPQGVLPPQDVRQEMSRMKVTGIAGAGTDVFPSLQIQVLHLKKDFCLFFLTQLTVPLLGQAVVQIRCHRSTP